MTDAERDLDLKDTALEEIATLAVMDIAAAIGQINKRTAAQMVRWPLSITVMNGYAGERTFDFANLYRKASDAGRIKRAE